MREKQVKDMDRDAKLAMIKNLNPNFEDLYPKVFEGWDDTKDED